MKSVFAGVITKWECILTFQQKIDISMQKLPLILLCRPTQCVTIRCTRNADRSTKKGEVMVRGCIQNAEAMLAKNYTNMYGTQMGFFQIFESNPLSYIRNQWSWSHMESSYNSGYFLNSFIANRRTPFGNCSKIPMYVYAYVWIVYGYSGRELPDNPGYERGSSKKNISQKCDLRMLDPGNNPFFGMLKRFKLILQGEIPS